jgi:hypothetical protein
MLYIFLLCTYLIEISRELFTRFQNETITLAVRRSWEHLVKVINTDIECINSNGIITIIVP